MATFVRAHRKTELEARQAHKWRIRYCRREMQQQGIQRQDSEDASLINPHRLMEHENEWSARKNSLGSSYEGIDPRRAIRYIIKIESKTLWPKT